MGSPKGSRSYCTWSTEEEESLRLGVVKHGLGSWEIIRRDPEFPLLEWVTAGTLAESFGGESWDKIRAIRGVASAYLHTDCFPQEEIRGAAQGQGELT